MNYIVIILYKDSTKDVFWFESEQAAKEFKPFGATKLQIISTADSKQY